MNETPEDVIPDGPNDLLLKREKMRVHLEKNYRGEVDQWRYP